jgi:hypothetical protein
MYKIIIWDDRSPNYGTNCFTDGYGTDTMYVESYKAVQLLMSRFTVDKHIRRARIIGPGYSFVFWQDDYQT